MQIRTVLLAVFLLLPLNAQAKLITCNISSVVSSNNFTQNGDMKVESYSSNQHLIIENLKTQPSTAQQLAPPIRSESWVQIDNAEGFDGPIVLVSSHGDALYIHTAGIPLKQAVGTFSSRLFTSSEIQLEGVTSKGDYVSYAKCIILDN